MERLTIRNADGSVSQPTASTFEKVFDRLAEYEDLGMSPEEIKNLIAESKRNNLKFDDPTIPGPEVQRIFAECKNRADLSYYKYGPVRANYDTGRLDAIGSADRCLIKFRRTKNTEYLLDVINYMIFRILYPLPGEFFSATDSGESAGVDGTPVTEI